MSDLAVADRLRFVSDDVSMLADLLRDDAMRTGELAETAIAALLAPELTLTALVSPVTHAEAVARLLGLEALAGAHAAKAMGRWGFLDEVGAAFQATDLMLAALRPDAGSPGEAAWRVLLADVQLQIAMLGPGLDVLLGTATAALLAAGVPLMPKLPPATSYPDDWGDEDLRIRQFQTDLAELYGEGFPPTGMHADGAGRVIPMTTESLLVSAAQAAKLGAPSAAEADGAVVRVVAYPTDPPTFIALIPGSAGVGFTSPSDWGYNVTGGLPLQAAARDALDRAIADYGPTAGERPRVGLIGFSQGGIAALGLGARLGPGYEVALIETAGTPDLGDVLLPEGTRVLSFADRDDPVPMLDGRSNPGGWEQIEVDAGGIGFDAHNELGYARALHGIADDPIAGLAAQAKGAPMVSDYFYVMR